MVGIDITIAPLRNPSYPPPVRAMKNLKDNCKHLQETERKKIQRAKRIDKDSDDTIDGETVTADLLDMDHVLIPGAIDQHGELGPCLRRFLFGTQKSIPHPKFTKKKPHSKSTFHKYKAHSSAVPSGVTLHANQNWTQHQATTAEAEFYGTGYLEPSPQIWVIQRLGMGIVSAMANHIKFCKFTTEMHGRTLPRIERCWVARPITVLPTAIDVALTQTAMSNPAPSLGLDTGPQPETLVGETEMASGGEGTNCTSASGSPRAPHIRRA